MRLLTIIVLSMNLTAIPNDRNAELALIGAAMQGKYDDILSAGCDESFFNDIQLQQVWLEMGKMASANQTVCEETVMHRMSRSDDLGIKLFNQCLDKCPVSSSWEHWFKLCGEQRKDRAILQVGISLTKEVEDGDDLEQVVANAERCILELSRGTISSGRDMRGDGVEGALDTLTRAHNGEQVGLATGLACLDALLGGMFPGELIILAGRPATGKTALALNIADYHANKGQAVAFFSYEMTSSELVMRVATERSDIDLRQEIINHRSDEAQRAMLIHRAAPHFAKLKRDPLIIINEKYTPAQIASKARKLKRDHDIKLIVVDYLQLVAIDRDDRRMDRHVQVGNISNALKALAMELQIPILALAQFNRAAANDDRAPSIAQIRESGSIEQDGDVVWMMWVAEPSMFDGPKQLLKLDIGKNRKGRQGSVDIVFTRNKLRFEDAAEPHHETWLNEKRSEQVAC